MHKGTSSKIRVGANHNSEAQTGWAIRSDFIEKRCPERRPYLRHPTSVGQLEVIFLPPKAENVLRERRQRELGAHSKPGGPAGCGGCVRV